MKLKELSELLGLSPTTVSRALNGYPEVSEATRERVRKVAAERNYRPNHRAMGLATGRAMAIGHVIPVDSEDEMVNPIFGEFLAGASEVYNHRGYELLLSIATANDEEIIYRNLVAKGAVDGFIVQMPREKDHRIKLLRSLDMPFVLHGRSGGLENDYSWVDVDNETAFRSATEMLLELGHRRIGLINGLEWFDFAIRRRKGYEAALSAANINIDPMLMRSQEMTETYGYLATQELLRLDSPPTALLASSHIIALGVQRAANEHGLRVGEDLSVVIHDDELSYFSNAGETPVFSGTRSSVREAGRKAAEMLLELINTGSLSPLQHLLEPKLIPGRSTAKPTTGKRGCRTSA